VTVSNTSPRAAVQLDPHADRSLEATIRNDPQPPGDYRRNYISHLGNVRVGVAWETLLKTYLNTFKMHSTTLH